MGTPMESRVRCASRVLSYRRPPYNKSRRGLRMARRLPVAVAASPVEASLSKPPVFASASPAIEVTEVAQPLDDEDVSNLEDDDIKDFPGGLLVRDTIVGNGDVIGTGDAVVMRVKGFFRVPRYKAIPLPNQELDEVMYLNTGGEGEGVDQPVLEQVGLETFWMPERLWDGLSGMRFGGRRSVVLPTGAGQTPPQLSGLFGRASDEDRPLVASPPAMEDVLLDVEILRCVDDEGRTAEGKNRTSDPVLCCSQALFPCNTNTD